MTAPSPLSSDQLPDPDIVHLDSEGWGPTLSVTGVSVGTVSLAVTIGPNSNPYRMGFCVVQVVVAEF